MTGPREELALTGRPGTTTAHLLYRTVRLVAVTRNFPPPPGSASWDTTAVTETAHDLIDGERGRKRLADALLRSTDEESFARILEGAAVNFLRDAARATDLGKVVLRVAEILRSEDFRAHGGRPPRWGLPSGPDTASPADDDALGRAAMSEPVVDVPAWTSDRRDAPIADRASLVRILRRVLAAADGGLTAAQAARAVAARVDVRRSPLTVEVGVLEGVAEPPAGSDPGDAAASAAEVSALFARLDDRERIAVATFHEPLPVAAQRLALGRSQASLARQRVVRRLQRELGVDLDSTDAFDAADADAAFLTARALRDLCVGWADTGT